MPTAKMKKLLLVGNNSQRTQLLKKLQKYECTQIVTSNSIELADSLNDINRKAVIIDKLARVNFAFQSLKEYKARANKLIKADAIAYTKTKKPLIAKDPEIGFDAFIDTEKWDYEIFEKITEIENLSVQLQENKTKVLQSTNFLKTLLVYRDIDMSISLIKDTKHCSITMGNIPLKKIDMLKEIETAFPNVILESYAPISSYIPIIIICEKTIKDQVYEKLSEAEFTQLSLKTDKTIDNYLKDEYAILTEYKQNEVKLIEQLLSYEYILDKCRIIFDYYTLELEKVDAVEGMVGTKNSFYLEAWLPTDKEEFLNNKLENSKLSLVYFIREHNEFEEPPTLINGNNFSTPYESVTNMFSVPKYGEINPNGFVGFFFFLFFGIMVSDAGYGLLMVLATSVILAVKKPKKNESSLIKVIFMGGISTVFWGIMFGSVFGLTLFKPILFNPIDDPISMLALTLGLGLFQMMFGMGINAYILFKEKKPLDAIFGVFSWYALIIGIALFAIIRVQIGKTIGISLAVAGLVGMMIAGAMHRKGVGGRLTGALSNLYGIINFFGDLLSYTRLFGLGLATGVIAMVFNQIAMVFVDLIPIIGYVMAGVILIVGHVFNVAINTLGAYVHDSRLQFVEFLGKFYSGGGKLFKPLGTNMKYYKITKQKSEDLK